MNGAIEWLSALLEEGYKVCIYSSRSKTPGAIDAMIEWLIKHGARDLMDLNLLEFPTQKPAAYLTIDDRAICFRGTFPSFMEIEAFRPWNEEMKK